jgi:capsular polysaccharide biosynthesis protein/Mrp family chromosome partitioning ATPase
LELEVFAQIMKRWWLGILAALLLGSLIGFSFAESRTPVYQSGTDLLVGPLSADSNVLRAAGQTAQTYAELASASSTIEIVAAEIADPSAATVTVTATASDVTRILKVRVRGDDSKLVADVANGIADELERLAGDEVDAAQVSGDAADPSLARVGEVRVLEAATPPAKPIAPNKPLIIALGGLALMITALVAIIAYEYTRQAVRVIGDLDRIVPGSVLGRIERSWDTISDVGGAIAVHRNEHGPTSTSLRGLSVDLVAQLPPGRSNEALVFGGVDDGDRSADVAVNVAAALASTGRSVALIDANEPAREVRAWLWPDCDHPVEPLAVQINPNAKISLDGRYTLIDSGVLDLYSTELTRLPELEDLESALADLGAGYDHVVMHTAPAFGSPAAMRWAASAAGSVLVVTADVASAPAVERCALTLSRGSAYFIGTVFDERPRAGRSTSLLRRLFGGGARSTASARPVRSANDAPPVVPTTESLEMEARSR